MWLLDKSLECGIATTGVQANMRFSVSFTELASFWLALQATWELSIGPATIWDGSLQLKMGAQPVPNSRRGSSSLVSYYVFWWKVAEQVQQQSLRRSGLISDRILDSLSFFFHWNRILAQPWLWRQRSDCFLLQNTAVKAWLMRYRHVGPAGQRNNEHTESGVLFIFTWVKGSVYIIHTFLHCPGGSVYYMRRKQKRPHLESTGLQQKSIVFFQIKNSIVKTTKAMS